MSECTKKTISKITQLEYGKYPDHLIIRHQFIPECYKLDKNFRLTNFADLKKRNGTVPNNNGNVSQEEQDGIMENLKNYQQIPRIDTKLNCSVTPVQNGNLCLVQATNSLCPLIDDPYMLGRITFASVLSNFYAMGVTICENFLIMLDMSTKMTEYERNVMIQLLVTGFTDSSKKATTIMKGCQTMLNRYCTIAGLATSVCSPMELIVPENAQVDDVLLLTKPLGTKVAITVYQWLDIPELWMSISHILTKEEAVTIYERAIDSMIRLNRVASILSHKYSANAVTDITDLSFIRHVQNLAVRQKNKVQFIIQNMPIFNKMTAVSNACSNTFELLLGHCTETSGGLLVSLPRDRATQFCKEIQEQEGYEAWIIGKVMPGDRTAKVMHRPRVIEVPSN